MELRASSLVATAFSHPSSRLLSLSCTMRAKATASSAASASLGAAELHPVALEHEAELLLTQRPKGEHVPANA